MVLNPPRTIFITGASSGIGAATALEAVQREYQVVGTGSRAFGSIPGELQCLPQDRFVYVQADLTAPEQLPLVRQQGLAQFSDLGTVYGFLNGGIFVKDNAGPEKVQRMFSANVAGNLGIANLLRDLIGEEGGLLASSSIVSAERLTIPDAVAYRQTKDQLAAFILGMPNNPDFQGVRGGVVYIGASPTGMTTSEGELIMGMLLTGALSSQADPELQARLYASLAEQGAAATAQTPEAFLQALLGEQGITQMGQDRAGRLALTLIKRDSTLSSGKTRLPLARYFVTPGEVQNKVNSLLVANDVAVAPATVATQVLDWVDQGLPAASSPGTRRVYSTRGEDGPVRGLLATFTN